MRTTMILPDALLDRARRRADRDGRTVTSVMEEALRDFLDRDADAGVRDPLPTWTGGGRVLVDLDDADALADVLDAGRAT